MNVLFFLPIKNNDMADFSFVKDQNGKVFGVWVKNRSDADDQVYIITLFLRAGLSTDAIAGNHRIVPNTSDSNGGYFVMLGLARAPGE